MQKTWCVEPVNLNYPNEGIYENADMLLFDQIGEVHAILYNDGRVKANMITEEDAILLFKDESIHINS